MNAQKSIGATVLHKASQFGNWIIDTALPFLWKHWKWTWLVLAVLGALLSVAKGATLGVIFAWITLVVGAIITIADKWDTVVQFLWKQFTKLSSAFIDTMTGGKGLLPALFTSGAVFFMLGFLVGGANGPIIACVGVLLIIGATVISFDKMVNKK